VITVAGRTWRFNDAQCRIESDSLQVTAGPGQNDSGLHPTRPYFYLRIGEANGRDWAFPIRDRTYRWESTRIDISFTVRKVVGGPGAREVLRLTNGHSAGMFQATLAAWSGGARLPVRGSFRCR
jgi:hypothetical protein